MKNQNAHRSYYNMPFSNGFSAGNFNVKNGQIDSFTNHIFKQYDAETETVNIIQSLDFELDFKNKRVLLSDLKLKTSEYMDSSGIVRAAFETAPGGIDAYFFSSFLREYNNLNVIISANEKTRIRAALKFNPDIGAAEIEHNIFRTSIGTIYVNEKQGPHGYHLLISQFSNFDTSPPQIAAPKIAKDLESEIEFWKDWHKKTVYTGGLSPDEKALYKQSASILKMSQCREPGRGNGQMLASLPPGMWNICWIRDSAYSIHGLLLSGHIEEVKDALSFFLNADVGKYKDFRIDKKEVGIGMPYQISVCRYYGNGEEESDGGDDPNIELDGFGLFLWVLEEYVEISNDIRFLKEYWDKVSIKIADTLIQNIDSELSLIRPDSSIWERHIRNNGRETGAKHFAYTTITAVKGLESAARLADKIDDKERRRKYDNAAAALKHGFLEHLISPEHDTIMSAVENRKIDGAVVEAINFGIIPPDSAIAQNTLTAFDEFLKIKNRESGYFRNLDGTHYDNQEWIMIDLRIAAALKKAEFLDKSREIVSWVTAQSKLNFNLIAELYNEYSSDYEGAVPMAGFGAGAYIAALWGN